MVMVKLCSNCGIEANENQIMIDVAIYGWWCLSGDIFMMLIGFSWLDHRTARCTAILG